MVRVGSRRRLRTVHEAIADPLCAVLRADDVLDASEHRFAPVNRSADEIRRSAAKRKTSAGAVHAGGVLQRPHEPLSGAAVDRSYLPELSEDSDDTPPLARVAGDDDCLPVLDADEEPLRPVSLLRTERDPLDGDDGDTGDPGDPRDPVCDPVGEKLCPVVVGQHGRAMTPRATATFAASGSEPSQAR